MKTVRHLLAALAFGLLGMGSGSAAPLASWDSTCLVDLRQVKEDWTRISTDATKNAVAKEVTAAEQSYRKGDEQKCREIVARIKDMMR